jgi:hypothetical protein
MMNQGTRIEMKECLLATAALIKEIISQNCLRSVQILHDILFCEETASKCLPYGCTEPSIAQIPAFLVSKDWLLKCVCLKVLIFKYLLLTLK